MSGGVDSSVAAAMLATQGHDVTGVTLKLWGGESDSGCCSVADVEDARRVAAQLDIPHYVFNFSDAFDADVVAPYADAYDDGPHAEPVCGVQPHRSSSAGCSSVPDPRLRRASPPVTTRRVDRVDGRWRLRAGRRCAPRTSRTCSTCSASAELARTLLPVGELTKAEVRAHAARARSSHRGQAREHGRVLHHAGRPRPVPRVPAVPAARRRRRHRGRAVGVTIDGIAAFTVGQRRGLAVAAGERRYVVDVDAHDRHGHDRDPRRPAARLGALDDVAFVHRPPVRPSPCTPSAARTATPVAARLVDDVVHFAAAAARVAPGQVVALYDGDVAPRRRHRREPRRGADDARATRRSASGGLSGHRQPSLPAGAGTSVRRTTAMRTAGRDRRRRDAAAPASVISASSSKRIDERAARCAEAEVGRSGGRRSRRAAAAAGHVLAQEQQRVGERHGVDDHEPGGHEHGPAARAAVRVGGRSSRSSRQPDHERNRRPATHCSSARSRAGPATAATDEDARDRQRARGTTRVECAAGPGARRRRRQLIRRGERRVAAGGRARRRRASRRPRRRAANVRRRTVERGRDREHDVRRGDRARRRST